MSVVNDQAMLEVEEKQDAGPDVSELCQELVLDGVPPVASTNGLGV